MTDILTNTRRPTLQQLQQQAYSVGQKALPFARSTSTLALGVFILSTLASTDVLAELPKTVDEVVPNGVGGTDTMTMGARIMQIIFQIVAAGLGILAVLIPAASIIKSYRSRKGNDNDDFHSTVVGGLFVMVFGLGLALTGWTYSQGLAAAIMQLA
ncbi:hypothetical protein HDN1F_35060 [gamma proteobacterium HdN1]|nr:Hypothetical protein HDN1F_18130 [gamma proteobacterium HdN1]CBL47089.1 hypothetical protein HDN1F_35060 [gamma proteobacterium HdN1]